MHTELLNRRRRALLLAGAGLPLGAWSTLSQADDTPELAERLIVAYNDDYAPYSYVENGVVKGILPDAINVFLASMPKLKVESVGLPWRRVQAEVRSGVADAMCTFASAERQEFVVFHKVPVVVLQPHLFFAAASPLRETIEGMTRRDELTALRVVDLKGNNWAEQNFKDIPGVTFSHDHDSVFRLIMAGRSDVHVSLSPTVTKWRIKKLGFPPEQILSRPAPFVAAEVPFHLLIRKTHPRGTAILKYLDDALRKPNAARQLEEITRRYI
jgi:polar amino acid transport system substrate-binding protein